MTFEHAIHRDTHARVREYLSELFDQPHEDSEDGHFYVTYGSTVLEVSVDPYGPEDAAVLISSYCVQGVIVEESLLRGLLETNHQVPFGAFSLVGDDIFFSYGLFGSALDRGNLLGALAAVATLADDYDDQIVSRFGGQTALDRMSEPAGRRGRRRGRAASQ